MQTLVSRCLAPAASRFAANSKSNRPIARRTRVLCRFAHHRFALALGGAVILDRPLCYYRQHSQNLFAPIAMDGAAERRRFEQLRFLLSYVPPRLAEFGVAPDVIDAFVESARVEFERAKLYFGRGRKARGISHGAPKISNLLSESKRQIQALRVCSRGVRANPASAKFLSAASLVWPPQLRASPRRIRESGVEGAASLFSAVAQSFAERFAVRSSLTRVDLNLS